MNRRHFLLAGTAGSIVAATVYPVSTHDGDGTPLQFPPKTPKDAAPLENEFAKYPKCPYCGMDRKQFHFSRHLIQYSDDLVDGTCSIHCAAISLALNLDHVPKTSFASRIAAEAAKGDGEVVDFDKALLLAYQGMAEDTRMIRMRREEKRKAINQAPAEKAH